MGARCALSDVNVKRVPAGRNVNHGTVRRLQYVETLIPTFIVHAIYLKLFVWSCVDADIWMSSNQPQRTRAQSML